MKTPPFDKVIVVTSGLAICIFATDLLTPPGFGEWMIYLVAMLWTPRSRRPYYPIVYAGLCTVFVVAGYFHPTLPVLVFDFEQGFHRRLIGVFILWGMALVYTQRMRSEAGLRAREERFRSFMNNSSTLAWIKDANFNYVYVNQLFERLFDKSLETLKGKNDFELWPESFARAFRANDQQVLDSKTSLKTEESAPDPGGVIHHWLVHKFAFQDAGGQTFLGGVAADVTEQKRFEEALHNSELRFRSVWDNSADGMRLTDSEGTIVAVNHAYCKLAGMTEEELVGKPISVTYDCDREAVLKEYREGFSTRTIPGQQERTLEYRTGKTIEAEFSNSIIDLAGQPPLCLGLFRDISARKKQEEERIALERKVLDGQKLESLGVLAGGIAHDFNNLLTGVLGNASLCLMQTSEASPIRPNLESIEKLCLQAAGLCKQMLAFSGRGHFVIRKLDLNQLVTEMTELLKISIAKNVTLKFDLAADIPSMEADASQIQQIVMNLIINGSEAIGGNSGVVSIQTGVTRANRADLAETYSSPDLPGGDFVSLEITDSGCGMNAATKAKIFEPFFSTKFTGRGLGLAAVLGIVRGHKGALKVYSEPGRGTKFKLLFPCSDAKAMNPEPTPPPSTQWRGTGTILVVDDEASVRTIATRILELFGFKVLLASDGREGVEMFRANQDTISAVILDMTMPELNGDEVFREIRQIRDDAKVLLVSGYNEQDSIDRFAGKGLAGFLQKPFTPVELRDKLREILET